MIVKDDGNTGECGRKGIMGISVVLEGFFILKKDILYDKVAPPYGRLTQWESATFTR
jgi:hypothetical protein